MDVSTVANLINALAVTAGVIFAAVQIRDYRRNAIATRCCVRAIISNSLLCSFVAPREPFAR